MDNRPPLIEIGITLAGVALLAGLVLAVPALREAASAAIHGDTETVRSEVESLGIAGPLLIVLLALMHAVVFYPAEIVDAAAGLVYGFLPALGLMMIGWLLSGLACFAIGHSVARPLLDRWFGYERFERIEARIERGGAKALIAARLIPIFPFSIVSYAAGAARVPLWRFTWTTAIGYLPITAISVYFGTQLDLLSGLF
ncbi:MAG TPA: VTT domain-containing protein [Solirubrobacterales bacterium]|nr:VTT domain-containing protein [Solirubrobacterales bacterium]